MAAVSSCGKTVSGGDRDHDRRSGGEPLGVGGDRSCRRYCSGWTMAAVRDDVQNSRGHIAFRDPMVCLMFAFLRLAGVMAPKATVDGLSSTLVSGFFSRNLAITANYLTFAHDHDRLTKKAKTQR
ncbi:unnamed protein product [Soboliphyme baturini]|uniref:Transposase n=1 Tax=Soboliphyme baturini TaxID=241478 RepID=A0A183J7B5_9BILA|nr:unnamed protein product [Soboliphyme baturini]